MFKENNPNFENVQQNFPHAIIKLNTDADKEPTKYVSGYVQVGPKKYLVPPRYEEEAHIYYNFKVRPTDVYIVGFPRCGTTLTQELIWLLENDLDYNTASEVLLAHRFPYLERTITFNKDEHKEIDNLDDSTELSHSEEVKKLTLKASWQLLEEMDEDKPRLMKSHLPFSLLPQNMLEVGCKVVYLARNPKDVAVSFYHLNNLFKYEGYELTFEQHWRLFQKGLLPFTPYLEHVKEGWALRDNPNLLFIFYEEINKNFRETVLKIANFLNKILSEAELNSLEEHFKIENFRKNKSVNNEYLQKAGILNPNSELNFIRKGVVGDWKEYFDPRLNEEANEWVKENVQDVGLEFVE